MKLSCSVLLCADLKVVNCIRHPHTLYKASTCMLLLRSRKKMLLVRLHFEPLREFGNTINWVKCGSNESSCPHSSRRFTPRLGRCHQWHSKQFMQDSKHIGNKLIMSKILKILRDQRTSSKSSGSILLEHDKKFQVCCNHLLPGKKTAGSRRTWYSASPQRCPVLNCWTAKIP
jgi:hypothetical protein